MKKNDIIIIKEMVVKDINSILEIENLCFSQPWTYNSFLDELLKNRLAYYHIVSFNNKIVGYSGLWKVIDEGHITNIAIHSDFRRMGMASKLLEYMFNFCNQQQITQLTLEVRKNNLPAQNLYKKYGFSEKGIRKAYYSDNKEDAIIMWKQL